MLRGFISALSIAGGLSLNSVIHSEGEENIHPGHYHWSHYGAFSSFDYAGFGSLFEAFFNALLPPGGLETPMTLVSCALFDVEFDVVTRYTVKCVPFATGFVFASRFFCSFLSFPFLSLWLLF